MPSPIARFAFKSPQLEVEFEGHPEFIQGQIRFLEPQIAEIVQSAATGPKPAAPSTAAAAPSGSTAAPSSDGPPPAPVAVPQDTGNEDPTLDQFYHRARSREGRGALQETILIFAYFLHTYRDKDEFSIENLNACFSLVGTAPPKSLANTLGIMKRTQKFFHAGSQRGTYALTEKGAEYVKRLIGAV